MDLKKLVEKAAPRCSGCPYALGLVKTLVNPCPQCRASGSKPFVSPPGKP